jgi:cyclopropane-fatty-acyl-phospholipid synthase
MNALNFAENGWIPYWLIRFGIRQRLQRKLSQEAIEFEEKQEQVLDLLRKASVAEDTEKANEQHYELPPEFFTTVLGKRLKYSCAYWDETCKDLDEAEIKGLKQVAERAQLMDGQNVLELGCGWGSFTLWAAENFPNSQFTAVSNSRPQGDFIRAQAKSQGLENVNVITADMNQFMATGSYDRIVSIEMFEHMRNYEVLMQRISQWLKEDGLLFVHIFSHKDFAYTYNAEEENEWMARYFFTGGVMPSHSLLTRFDKHLKMENEWKVNGQHYQKTLEAWLEKFNRNENEVRRIFDDCYGNDRANIWMWRWRLFFLACSELFGYKGGHEWGVSHYTFKKAH